jgi:glycosyltransferase involved in cell wall biosynthesis
LTFHRPDQLADGLEPVLDQARHLVESSGGTITARVLVVDNDPDGSARGAVAELGAADVTYVIEPTPGIAAARNRALDESAQSDVLVFIDDDERPQPNWLASLVDTWQAYGSAAVAGRVVPVFTEEVDPWITDGRFFVRRKLATGTVVRAAAAGNLLLDVEQLASLGVRFDQRLGLGGGEDTLLTRQIVARGGTIVWCAESNAEDLVPADRLSRRWVLTRAWSHGNTTAVVDLLIARRARDRAVVRLRSILGGAARVLAGGARAVVGTVIRSNRHSARGLRAAFRGAGMAAAGLGIAYKEYARPAVISTSTDTHPPTAKE